MKTPTRITRLLAAATAAIAVSSATAACSSPGSDDTTYAPAAYGQQIGNTYDCYFIDDVDEVGALVRAGLCPIGSEPTVMPLYWQEEYWGYYSSPAYYGTYMPVRYRSHYTSVTVASFSRTYSQQISAASSKAVYKSSTGQRVTGVSKVKFGTGTSSGSKSGSSSVHGGGSRGSCAQSMTLVQMRSGSSGSGSSSSHGGGSRSGSGTSSGSKSGSGSRGGC